MAVAMARNAAQFKALTGCAATVSWHGLLGQARQGKTAPHGQHAAQNAA
jgi:hypothetical protein